MTYLVDANVLSEATKPEPSPRVLAWLREHQSEIVVDPIILGELRFGILLLGKGKRRDRLEAWFDEGVRRIQCVRWDSETSMRWAELLAKLRSTGRAMPIKDSLIAATALTRGFTIATRNAVDFAKTGLKVVNPFERD